MNDWRPLPGGVSWQHEPLFELLLRRSEIERRFGPPQHVDLDSNGIGDFDAWTLQFSCGLEVSLWWLEQPAAPHDPLQHAPVRANDCDHDHVRFHLGFAAEPNVFDGFEGKPGPRRWAVKRTDDNGNTFELVRVSSECEATAIAERYELRGHKQFYWVEALEGHSVTR